MSVSINITKTFDLIKDGTSHLEHDAVKLLYPVDPIPISL